MRTALLILLFLAAGLFLFLSVSNVMRSGAAFAAHNLSGVKASGAGNAARNMV
uniref:hypothetical protein n=1 Tax=Gemmiger formicilis TaxID=745368 RepID=UPI003FEDFE48